MEGAVWSGRGCTCHTWSPQGGWPPDLKVAISSTCARGPEAGCPVGSARSSPSAPGDQGSRLICFKTGCRGLTSFCMAVPVYRFSVKAVQIATRCKLRTPTTKFKFRPTSTPTRLPSQGQTLIRISRRAQGHSPHIVGRTRTVQSPSVKKKTTISNTLTDSGRKYPFQLNITGDCTIC